MKYVGLTIGTLLKRPFILIFYGIIFSIYYFFIDKINPLFTTIYGLNSMGDSDILGSLVALLQLLFEPEILTKGLLIFGALVLGVSLFVGLVFSGFFNTISSCVEKGVRTKGSFSSGIRKYFAKMFVAMLIVLIGGVLILTILMVASVPAIVVTKAATGKASFIIVAVLLDLITVVAVFFGINFYKIYVVFWFPAIFSGKKSFWLGKQTADSHFWGVLIRLLVLDMIFIASEAIFIRPSDSILFLIANGLFKTIFFSFYTAYIFQLFMQYRKTKQELPVSNPALS